MANKKTRMYEPWGYQEENNYNSTENMMEGDFEAFLVGASYNKDDNKIYFTNKDGEQKASLDVNEFVKSDSIIDKVEYNDGILKITFTNGDVITIDLTELLDENEFKDGLIVADHVVKVLINSDSDDYISVDGDGVKLTGVKADIEAEKTRAEGEEQRIDAKLDQEIADRIADVEAEEARATSAETALNAKIDAEVTRAEEAEAALDEKIDSEIARAKAAEDAEKERAEAAEAGLSRRNDTLNDELDAEKTIRESEDAKLDRKIDKEIDDREADVDEEETRAKAAEEALDAKIDQEISDREADVDAEETRAEEAEATLQAAIEAEGQRAQDAETALDAKIDAVESALTDAIADEQARAEAAEESLENAKFDNVVYDSTAKTITFYANSNLVGTIDTTDFVKDGMIDDVKIENDKLVIVFNTDAGKETIEIPLSDIFNPNNYYDKDAIDDIVSGINASISEEAATRAENDEALSQSIEGEKTRAEEKETALQTSIDAESTTARAAEQANAEAIVAEKDRAEAAEALKANSADVYTKGEVDGKDDALQAGIDANVTAIAAEEAARIAADEAQDAVIATKADASAVTESIEAEAARAISAETDLQDAIDLKADKETTYTKEEVDALIAEKEAEIVQIKKDYNSLKEIVGELGGNVEWGVPADGTFNNMMKKSGTVKLGEDTTTSTYTGGITSKNKTTLHLNGKNLTFSGSTTNNPGIMTRGEQKLTIMGKGTFDAAGRIAVEANGADTVINLSGTTGFFAAEPTYVTDRSGGELIYCYLGTINISAGVFKNNGEDKKFLLNCYDANYRAGTAKIVVTGGKFYDFNPADNSAEGEHTSFVPEGYHVEVSQDGDSTVYTVKKDA